MKRLSLAMVASIVSAMLTVVLVSACAPSANEAPVPAPSLSDSQRARLDAGLEQISRDFGLMGLGVAYLEDFRVAYEGYTGWAVYETEVPFNRGSVVRIASPSKTVTALALMQLAEQGLVDLDADVSDALGWELRSPSWPNSPITLRMLLGHTSGIADGPAYDAFARVMIPEQRPLQMLFVGSDGAEGAPDPAPGIFSEHEPGTYFAYSNAAWGLVASVIERVTGERFDRLARARIFEPLGIAASFNVADLPADHIAALYRIQDGEWRPQVDHFIDAAPEDRAYAGYEPGHNGLLYAPQGGLRISMAGLIVLADLLMNGGQTVHSTPTPVRLLNEATLREMQAENWRYDADEPNGDTWDDFWLSYGLGVHRLTGEPGRDVIFPGMAMVGHPGIAYGLLSDLYVDPFTGTGVIFVTTGSQKPFEIGETSSFYEVEEAVFRLLAEVRDGADAGGGAPSDAGRASR
jgi:CubicO group peptidase (beta-lactamase class C family)